MQTLGFEDRGLAWDGQASRHGPNFFSYSEEIGIWGVFEAKGGSGKLDLNTQFGAQMDWRWIDHWYETIGDSNADVAEAYDEGNPLLAMVVSLDFRRSQRSGVKNEGELRVGFQVWNSGQPGRSAWDDWQKGKDVGRHLGF